MTFDTCVRVSFLLNLQSEAWNLKRPEKETLAQVFSCEFCKISKNSFSHRTLPVAASALSMIFSYFLDGKVYRKWDKKILQGFTWSGELEVKKLMPSTYPPWWVIPLDINHIYFSTERSKKDISRFSSASSVISWPPGNSHGIENPLQVTPL